MVYVKFPPVDYFISNNVIVWIVVENSRQHPHNCSLYPGRLVHELIQRRESLESKSGLQVELIEELSNTSEIMNNVCPRRFVSLQRPLINFVQTGNDMQYWKECEARAKQDEVYDLSQKRQSRFVLDRPRR